LRLSFSAEKTSLIGGERMIVPENPGAVRVIYRDVIRNSLPILCCLFVLAACSAESTNGGTADAAGSDGSITFTGAGDTKNEDASSADSGVSAPDFGLQSFDFGSQNQDADPKIQDVGCTPSCGDRTCGPDGCGGECGQCADFEVCSSAGLCGPDPRAGCAGLELAENWGGTFEGEYEVSPLGLLPATNGDTDGDLSFTLKCFNSKLIVNGAMTGTASGDNPFELTLAGYFDPTTNLLDGQVPEGSVTLNPYGVVEFEGVMPGTLQADGSLSGTYEVDAVAATLFGSPIDINTMSASSAGTWVAFPQ
jgi:hypothetical protein